MAYAIINNDQLYRIASDDDAKTNLNLNESDYTIMDITDEQFNKLKKEEATISGSSGSYSVTDLEANHPASEGEVKAKIQGIVDIFEYFLVDHENHSMANDIRSYITFLKEIDTSSISYPMSQSFFDYVESQSQTVISPLQV